MLRFIKRTFKDKFEILKVIRTNDLIRVERYLKMKVILPTRSKSFTRKDKNNYSNNTKNVFCVMFFL